MVAVESRMSVRTSLTHPIRVDWIATDLPGRVGLTFAPGKHAHSIASEERWERDLAADLDRLVQHYGMQVQVCLLEDHELTSLGIPTLIDEATARGVRVVRLPIPDGHVLRSLTPVLTLVDDILAAARSGAAVVVHCRGGLGRAGTVGGCVLARLGMPVDDVYEALRAARGANCPETSEQRGFIRRFAGQFGGASAPRT